MSTYQTHDPATEHTAAGIPAIKTMGSNFAFCKQEKERLRALASEVAEVAAAPVQQKKRELWTEHNDLQTKQPVVFIDPENGWNECIKASDLTCVDPLARVWEMDLLKKLYWFQTLKDDKVIDNYFDVPFSYEDTGWGVPIVKEGGDHQGAYKVKPGLVDYEEDFEKIHYPKIIIDEEESEQALALAQDVFGEILTVRRKTPWWWTLGMTWDYINLRGLEEFMCDFLLEPEWVHKTMQLMCDGILARLDTLEEGEQLASNAGNTYVGSGGFGFTSDLPEDPPNLATMDMWGFVESQETTAISPDLYGEFIFPYHKKIAERFGLNCYGCCEPFDPRWEYVKQLPRLRRVSCSPWAKLERVPELLEDRYIASIKLSPTPLAENTMDEALVRKEIKDALEATEGCVVELIMKDNNTLGNNPRNASRWVEIAREEIDLY